MYHDPDTLCANTSKEQDWHRVWVPAHSCLSTGLIITKTTKKHESSRWIMTEMNCNKHYVIPVIRYLWVFELDSLQKAKTWEFDFLGCPERKRGGLLRWAEIWWDFIGMGTTLSNQTRGAFILMMAKTRWALEAGAVFLAIGSNTIWQLFPAEIILLMAPFRIQVTKLIMENIGYRHFNFQLI